MLYFCTEIVFWKFDLELILQKNKNSLRLACMKKNLEKFRTKLIEIWSSQNLDSLMYDNPGVLQILFKAMYIKET